MRVIITGATGFIGSHLVRAFLERGAEVRALIRQGPPRLGVLPQEAGLPLVYGDLEHVAAAVPRIGSGDVFLHMAGGGVTRRALDPPAAQQDCAGAS